MQQITQPTIFLPGTQCDERIWIPLWAQLDIAQRSYVPLQWAETLEHMMALTQDRIDSFDGKVNLVGYSMGGYIASLAANKNSKKIQSLTLIGYHPGGLDKSELSNRAFLLKAIKSGQKLPFNNARLLRFITESELQNSNIVSSMKEMDRDLGASVLAAHISATTPRQDTTELLSRFDFPIHFIGAERDNIAPIAQIQKANQMLSKSTIKTLSNTAHMMPLTKPNELAEALLSTLVAPYTNSIKP